MEAFEVEQADRSTTRNLEIWLPFPAPAAFCLLVEQSTPPEWTDGWAESR